MYETQKCSNLEHYVTLMPARLDYCWGGEKNRPFGLYRPCPCGVCSKSARGVGFLSWSNRAGQGFTIWITDEGVFRRLRQALYHRRRPLLNPERCSLVSFKGGCKEELQNISPAKPDRIELLKQVHRATIEDQLHLLHWLEKKHGKIKSETGRDKALLKLRRALGQYKSGASAK